MQKIITKCKSGHHLSVTVDDDRHVSCEPGTRKEKRLPEEDHKDPGYDENICRDCSDELKRIDKIINGSI
jgi:hypothetical protein